jgi:hypothetical protein
MHSLTSATDGGEWSASRPGHFTPGGRTPCTHWTEGWVGPRNGLDTVSKRKIPSPRRDSKADHPIVQARSQSLYRVTIPDILKLSVEVEINFLEQSPTSHTTLTTFVQVRDIQFPWFLCSVLLTCRAFNLQPCNVRVMILLH